MKVTVVGCSGSYPGPRSPASCYLLEAPFEGRTWRVVLDLGSGALGALHRYVDPLTIDAVLISHLHADHCLDLAGYYVMRKYHPTGHQPMLTVWGPSDTAGRMARAYDLPEDPGMTEEFDFRPWVAPITIGPFGIEPFPVDHPDESFGLRITVAGRTLAYSGDTAPCPGLEAIAKDADLFLVEASFRGTDDNPPGVHLTGTECGEVATRARAHRVVLTHVPPWFDPEAALAEAEKTYDGPLELATAGAVYEI